MDEQSPELLNVKAHIISNSKIASLKKNRPWSDREKRPPSGKKSDKFTPLKSANKKKYLISSSFASNSKSKKKITKKTRVEHSFDRPEEVMGSPSPQVMHVKKTYQKNRFPSGLKQRSQNKRVSREAR